MIKVKNLQIITILIVIGSLISAAANISILVSKNLRAKNLYEKTLSQARTEVAEERMLCRMHTTNQELERLTEALQSDNPKATYERLSAFPLVGCAQDIAEKELVVFRLREFKDQYIEKIKEEL